MLLWFQARLAKLDGLPVRPGTGSHQITITMGCLMRGLIGRRLAIALICLGVLYSNTSRADRLDQPAQPAPQATQALLLDIAQAGDRLVAVGEQGIVLLSDDQGDSWRMAQVPVSVMLTAVQFPQPRLGWAVGHDGVVLHSKDAGESWQRVLTGRDINALRTLQLTQQLADLTATVDEALHETLEYALEDAQAAEADGPTTPLLDVWFRDALTGFVLGGYGLLLKTEDGGQSWRSLGHQADNPDGFHLNSLLARRDGSLLIAGEAGLLLAADAGGEQWQALDSPYDGSFFAAVEADQLYVMGLRGHLFRSTSGQHWQPVALAKGDTGSLNGAVADSGKLWLLGQAGALLEATAQRVTSLDTASRRSFSAGARVGQSLILVGEGGITRLALASLKPQEPRP